MYPVFWLLLLGATVFAFYSIITQTFDALAFVFIVFFALLFYGIHLRLVDPRRPEDAYDHIRKAVEGAIPKESVIPGLTRKYRA
jgi:hypothetical protein